ncbi:protein takeout-like isoform X2 [Zootermopsis nevadensis]|uniref:protein takeout-like isoform X2 n=1 Tax=Zootermopsis nevadensis TaxID=136037 RepID=UPI000B8EB82E|nr:protein takeout-like isoform X2 [Zootermopsis nevadensis]
MLCSLVLLAFSVGPALGYFKEKPPFMQVCYKADPEFVRCSTEAVQMIMDSIKNGLPALGIEPLDPFNIPEIKILQGGDGPVALNASLVNVTVRGLTSTKILSNKVNFETYAFSTQMKIPRLRIDAVYTLKGRILVLPIVGHGDAWLEPEDLDIMSEVDLTLRSEDGITFFKVQDVQVNFTIGKLRLRLKNLYNGLKALEDSTNEYINSNWRSIAGSLKPILSRTIADLVGDVLTKLFDGVPAKYFIGDLS